MSWWVLFSRSCCMIHEAILLCRAVNPADLEVLKMFNACFKNTWKEEKGNSFSVCVIFLTLNIHYSISPRDDYISFCPIRLCIQKKCTESTCDAVTPVLKVEANFSLEITFESSTYVQSSILSELIINLMYQAAPEKAHPLNYLSQKSSGTVAVMRLRGSRQVFTSVYLCCFSWWS